MTKTWSKESKQELIEIGSISIKVVRNVRRKTLTLEVDTLGAKVRAPLEMRIGTIRNFVKSKEYWLKHHYENRPQAIEPLELCEDAKLKLLDQEYRLTISNQKRGAITLDNNVINVPLLGTRAYPQVALKTKLTKWFKQQAITCLRDKVFFFSEEMSIPLPTSMNIKVRDYKRRWGSCSHDGDLSFNWRIIMAPEQVVDYVVIHEIAHLREFNHSPRFWNIVSQQCPDWRNQRDWLNDKGGALYRF